MGTVSVSTSLFAEDGAACASEITFESPLLKRTFRNAGEDFEVDFISSEEGFRRQRLEDESSLQKALSAPKKSRGSRTRIFSIASPFSTRPLSITNAAMQTILEKLNVNMAFYQVIAAFGEKPRRSEAGLDCFFSRDDQESYELMYLFRFAEKDPGEESDWTLRQLGIYHRHDVNSNSTGDVDDTFLLLQPHKQSQFDYQLSDISENPVDIAALSQHPLKLHVLLFQTYFFSPGWRGYLEHASQEFTSQSDEIFTEKVRKDEGVTHDMLSQWRDLADRLSPVPAIIESQIRILEGLQDKIIEHSVYQKTNNSNKKSITSKSTVTPPTTFYLSMAKSLMSSAEVLRARIDGVIGLLANTIDMKNQYQAHLLNEHMRSLTQDTVDDSANIKIITIMSLIYLPASFLATLFGMNFFDFKEDAAPPSSSSTTSPSSSPNDKTVGVGRIIVSRDFWVFFALMIPLTLSTVGGWWLLSQRAKKKRDTKASIGNAAISAYGASFSSPSNVLTSTNGITAAHDTKGHLVNNNSIMSRTGTGTSIALTNIKRKVKRPSTLDSESIAARNARVESGIGKDTAIRLSIRG